MPKMSKDILPPDETRQVYDTQAETFAAKAPGLLWWDFIGKPAYDRHLSGFYGRRDVQTLDLGTASARVPQYLIEHGIPAENITGVELSPNQVAIARQRVPDATFIVGDITNVELPQDRFGLITSNMVFEFIDPEGLDRAFSIAYGASEPGGTLFYITTHPDKMKKDSGLSKPGRFETTFPWGEKGPNFFRTLEDFRSATTKAGFAIDSLEELQLPEAAGAVNPQEYARYTQYPHVRLAVRAHKPKE